jgi:hypothetical protein
MTHPVATARPLLTVHQGNEPVLVTAIHACHEMRPDLQEIIQLDESSRQALASTIPGVKQALSNL